MIGFFSLNRKIFKVYNSCDRDEFAELLNSIMDLPEQQIQKVFTSKRYLWNIIRPRDFYKMAAYYVVSAAKNGINLERIDLLIHTILITTPSQKICSSFVWNILKQIPLLTIDTIQYTSQEKIQSLLQSDKILFTDTAITPFVKEVIRLRKEIDMYQSLINE